MSLAPTLGSTHAPRLGRKVRALLIAFAVVLVALAGAGVWLSRESTLQKAAAWAVTHSNGGLTIDAPRGSLLSRAAADRIVWHTATRDVTFENVSLRWNPLWLLGGVIAVDNASADRVVVALKPSENASPLAPPSSLKPKLRVRVARAHAGAIDLVRNDSTTSFHNVGFTAGAGYRDWYFNLTPAQTPWGLLSADVKVGEEAPFDVNGHLEFTRKDPQPVRLVMDVRGPLERIGLDAALTAQTSKLTARATATPYGALPFTEVSIDLAGFNPRHFMSGAPEALLEGGVHVKPVAQDRAEGELSIANRMAGPVDQQRLPLAALTGAVTGRPDALTVDALTLDFGKGGKLAGDASVKGTEVSLRLAGNDVNGHAFHTALKPSHLSTKLGVSGDVRGQDVNVAFTQKDYDVALTGHLTSDSVVVKSARAHIAGGTLQASGRLGLSPDHAYTLKAKLDRFDLSRLGITKPEILAKSAVLNATVAADGAVAPELRVRADLDLARSTINGLPATAQVRWRSVGTRDARIGVNGTAHVGATTLAVDGHLVDPGVLASIDAKLDLSGESMEELYKVLGAPLPPTGPYRIAGRLKHVNDVWSFTDFTGTVGRSDLEGNYVFDRSKERPSIKATLVSSRLDFVDLQGFLGKKPGEPAAPEGKVLPQQDYQLDKLRATDVDVTFTGRRFANPRLPLTDMQTHLLLRNGLLTLNPLQFGMAGGRLDGWAVLDARKPVIEAETDLRGTGLNLNKLLPSVKAMVESTGKVDARVRLKGQGNSFAALMGSADGTVASVMEGGAVSDVVLRLANLDIANSLIAAAKGNQPIPVRCVVANFRAENGTFVPEPLLLDTQHTLVSGEGRVDLDHETLGLRLIARPKDGSILALRGPIDIQGPLAKPAVRPELGQAIARVGAAVALGAIAGPAAILPLIDPGKRQEVDCASYAQKARSFISQR